MIGLGHDGAAGRQATVLPELSKFSPLSSPPAALRSMPGLLRRPAEVRRPCRAPAERRLAESAWLQRWAVFQDSRPGGCLRSWRCNRRPGGSCQSSPVGFWRLLPRTLPDRYYLALSGHCYTSELAVESHVHISNGGPFRTCIWKKLPCCATARKRGRCRQWEPARRESTGRARAAVRVSTTGTIQTRMDSRGCARDGRGKLQHGGRYLQQR